MMIPMPPEQCQWIREELKWTALRPLDQVYEVGPTYTLSDGTPVRIAMRYLVHVSATGVRYVDTAADSLLPAVVVAGLKRIKHKLPKYMWLYHLVVVK